MQYFCIQVLEMFIAMCDSEFSVGMFTSFSDTIFTPSLFFTFPLIR